MNDPKAFYDKYKSLVYNLALNYSTNKEDADVSKWNRGVYIIQTSGISKKLILK